MRTLNGAGESVTSLRQGESYQIEAVIENLGPVTEAPMLIVQVKDANGIVLNIGTLKMTGFSAGASYTLTSGSNVLAGAVSGGCTVDVMVWSGWELPEILSEANSGQVFTIN